jgi:hypothetical protein
MKLRVLKLQMDFVSIWFILSDSLQIK